jgi:peptide/nickel transport system substrate-binding protein
MKRIVGSFIILAMAVSATGCAGGGNTGGDANTAGSPAQQAGAPQKGGTFVVAYSGDPISFNPNAKIDDFGYSIEQSLFNKLVTLDSDYQIIPDLAKSWQITDGGKTYTFDLVQGVKWHDGKPFTSADVKWTLDTIIKEKGVAYTNMKVIDAVETPDDHTVVLKLKEPSSPLLGFLAWYGTFIMPKHLYENTDWLTNPANQKPVGTGPFKFVEWTKGDHVSLAANPDYFGGAPYLDKVVYQMMPDSNTAAQALLRGEVDYSFTQPPLTMLDSLKKANIKVDSFPAPSRYYAQLNLRREPLQKLDVRKALAMAINRKEIVEKAFTGLGDEAWGFYTPAIGWAYDKSARAPEYDPSKAEQLLEQAGYKKGADGTRLKLSLIYFTAGQQYADLAQVIKSNLKQIGVDIQLQGLEIAAWSKKVGEDHDFDLAILAGFQGPDPDNMRNRFSKDGSIQFMGYSNPVIEKALDEGARETDQAKRAASYFAIQQELAKDLPVIPFAEVVSLYVYGNKVHGLAIHPENKGKLTTYNFAKVWLDK